MSQPVERYVPRNVTDLGCWTHIPLRLKVYSLTAAGAGVDDGAVATAKAFISRDVLPAVKIMGDSNDLGFVILHPGTLGLTVTAHWWVQGSVLCQRMFRQLYSVETPIDTRDRPVIGCVWELALIEAEQQVWRTHMMGATPDAEAYLAARAIATQV